MCALGGCGSEVVSAESEDKEIGGFEEEKCTSGWPMIPRADQLKVLIESKWRIRIGYVERALREGRMCWKVSSS